MGRIDVLWNLDGIVMVLGNEDGWVRGRVFWVLLNIFKIFILDSGMKFLVLKEFVLKILGFKNICVRMYSDVF